MTTSLYTVYRLFYLYKIFLSINVMFHLYLHFYTSMSIYIYLRQRNTCNMYICYKLLQIVIEVSKNGMSNNHILVELLTRSSYN